MAGKKSLPSFRFIFVFAFSQLNFADPTNSEPGKQAQIIQAKKNS